MLSNANKTNKSINLPFNSSNDNFISLNFKSNSIRLSYSMDFILKGIQESLIPGERVSTETGVALEAFTYDLLTIASLGDMALGYRSIRPDAFKGHRFGYRPFIRCFKWMNDYGYIEIRKGFYDKDKGRGEATRIRPTGKFLDLISDFGITTTNFRSHFALAEIKPPPVSGPVRVRASKSGDWWDQQKGALLPIDKDAPAVAPLIRQVERLNSFMDGHRVEHQTIPDLMHGGFYRLFNEGDRQRFAFDRGGRLYNLGAYQRIKREERQGLLINGEQVAEVDVAASHITVLHAMLGFPLLPSFDPYDVSGIPRGIVKSFIVMTIGNGRFQTRWSAPIAKKYLEKHGVRLQDAYPLGMVREAVLTQLPALAKLPESGLNWADLQYRESLGLIATVEALAYQHGVPSLPLHDSVIVPVSQVGLAKRVMQEAFAKESGVKIRVTVK